MGKEVGHKCVRTPLVFLVLAFFTVVASSPNLSTFLKRLQIYIIFIKLYTYLPFFLSIFAADIIYYIITF